DLAVAESNLRKERKDETKKENDERLAKAKELNDKLLQQSRAQRAAGFEDFKAGIELELLEAEKGGEQELALKKKLLNAELQIALENEKLTTNQRKLLIQQYFKDRLQLDKDYAAQRN